MARRCMARRCWPVAFVALFVLAGESRAQFTYFPYGIPLPPTIPALHINSGGIAFQYHNKNFNIAGFLGGNPTVVIPPGLNPFNPPFPAPFPMAIVPNPYGPNPFNPTPFAIAPTIMPFSPGVRDTRITIQLIQPVQMAGPQRFFFGANMADDPEIAGVDLDLVQTKKELAAVPKRPALPEVRPAVPAVAKAAPPDEAQPNRANLRPEKAADKKAEAAAQKANVLDLPLEDPAAENARLVELGLNAFRAQLYGVAINRFRQATEIEPSLARAYFLLAQASIAVGSYADAQEAIQAGLRLNRHWVRVPYQPRTDLYKGFEAEFEAHFKRVKKAQEQSANNPTYLFLTAYMLWFDDRRVDAVPLLRQARALVPDARHIDAFLRVEGANAN